MRTVGVGRRAAAFLIDYALFAVIGFCGLMIIALTSASGSSDGTLTAAEEEALNNASALFVFGLAALGFAYWVILEATTGRTLGKLFVGIQVVRTDGRRVGFGAALIRNLLRIVDGLFNYLVGAVFIWTSSSNQRLGDRAAKTIVVYDYSVDRPLEYGVNTPEF
jgi:uncharacterized RDD family membrane protein YckC